MSAGRILVVKDDDSIRAVVQKALESIGRYTVLSVSSGQQAVAVAADFMPDLMVLDVTMRGLDRPQTLQALREHPGLAAVPAVFLTAHTRVQEVGRYWMPGVEDVVARPFDPQHICQRIARVLGAGWAAPGVPAARRTALVVEDDPGVRYLLRFILDQQGYHALEAHDGRRALAALAGGPIADVVLLDIMLPGIDGLSLLKSLRRMRRWDGVPVLMLTANADEDSVQRALARGADDYLVKPFDPSELVARLQRLRRVEQLAPSD